MNGRFIKLVEMLDLKEHQHQFKGRIKDFYITTTQYNANDSWFFDIEFDEPLDIELFKMFIDRLELLPRKVQAIKYTDYKVSYVNNDYSKLEDYYDYIITKMSKLKPRFTSMIDFEVNQTRNRLEVVCPKDATFVTDLLYELKPQLMKLGFDALLATRLTSDTTIKERIDKQDEKFRNEVMQNADTDVEEIRYLSLENKVIRGVKNTISDIPKNENDLNEYKSMNDKAIFSLEGEVTSIDYRKLNPTTDLYSFILSDEEDSIFVKKFCKENADKDFVSSIKKGMNMKIKGVAQYDRYADDIVVIANIIEYTNKVVPKDVRKDLMDVKRIELHAHSKMSTLDGIDSVKDYVETAKRWGHSAIAITDKGNVQGFPELYKTTKDQSIKPIYGAEFTFIDEADIQLVKNPIDINISEATFTVFDIETTGLSVNFDKIIEIAAVKVKDGQIIDEYQTFVDPERQLSMLTTKLTNIRNADVKGQPKIDTVIKEFKEFFDGTIMVAHNAHFDMGFIESELKKHDLYDKDMTSIDTLSIARNVFAKDLKRFNLKAVSRYFNVELVQHHRAIYDTRATVSVFLRMMDRIRKEQGISNVLDLNQLSYRSEGYKHVISKKISLLVKNEVGLRNLFNITSKANTENFHKEARLLRSVLDENREGILVGTGCMNSSFLETALNKSAEELEEKMKYYDFVELSPINDFSYMDSDMENWYENIKSTYLRIIKVADKLNKPVVAIGDTYHINEHDSIYRDIYVQTPVVGGGFHPLSRYDEIPSQYFRTTKEMLNEFSFLDEDKRVEIVITNTHVINDQIEFVKAFKPELYAPTDDFMALDGIPSIENKLIKMVSDRSKEIYGREIPQLVKDRIDKEINSITSNKFSTVYYISHLLVKKSLDEGYLVGSRGSVGSSLVATLMDITEVNPLPPHYVCPKCHFSSFKMTNDEKTKYGIKNEEIRLQSILDKHESGFDLPKEECPICNEELNKDGHSIPFETFLGFKGDKVPDIDLNFSGDYQPQVHEYIRTIFGKERAFRAGTISTVADKTAYGYVKGYLEKKHLSMRKAEIERRSKKIVGVKRSTGQHPGGIVVVPNYKEIIDVTPVQFPADDTNASWRTTHFDYHSFEDNLFKLDVLGHDDPTMIRYLMDYVAENPIDFPFSEAQDIPLDDPKVYKLLYSTEIIGLHPEDLNSEVASFGIPEMGTKFVREMLTDARPKNFADAVKISGLSHGTDVWLNNAKSLVNGSNPRFGKIPFKNVIGCRDDIMVSLISWGMKEATAFEISEFIRKGKAAGNPGKWETYKQTMRGHKIPEWYIWSCGQIKYMFPKAHATAYVMMAMRIAWFKVYKPILFYSAYFSKRASDFDVYAMQGGEYEITKKLNEIKEKGNRATETEKRLGTVLELALEMCKRGFKFRPIDIEKSDSRNFKIHEDGVSLILPFITVDGLGLKVAESIVKAREEEDFKSKKDIQNRTSLSTTLFNKLDMLSTFDHLPDDSQINLFDM